MLEYLSADVGCVLEREPLEILAASGELCVYPHDGFWQCADTVRDVELLRRLWDAGDAPWRVWEDRRSQAAASAHPTRRVSDAVDLLLGSAQR